MTTIIDDTKLEQLAACRPKDLFPTLLRTASLSPLLVLLTVLPGIVALKRASVGELDARWQLKSLELATVSSVFDAVDPAASSSQRLLKWQPPLGSWIGAAAVHFPWPVVSPHGQREVDRPRGDQMIVEPRPTLSLDLMDYVFAAALVPAMYLLASRLFGRRIGFFTAALVAFHATFLEEHHHAAFHALAVVAALGAFWGFLGHLWHARGLVSLDLLCGGIALGLCLLSGGPLAFVVVAVLGLLVLGHHEPPAGVRQGRLSRGRRVWSEWLAFQSLGVMIATAFAAGGWWELMMLRSYGSDFLMAWLTGAPAGGPTIGPANPELAPAGFLIRVAREFFGMAGALSGLTVLGLLLIARNLFRSANVSRNGNLLFLAAWIGCAFVMFSAELRPGAHESLYFDQWRLFLMSACAVCSGFAIEEIARRRVRLPAVAAITIATLWCARAFLWEPSVDPSLWTLGIGLVVAASAAYLLRRVCDGRESRQRLALVALVAAQVLIDASLGLSAVRKHDFDSESLAVFRGSLPANIDADACMIISESEPPYRLQLALKSVWPRAELSVVRDWDKALKTALGNNQTPKAAVVVDWSQGNSRPANPTGARWEAAPVGNPQFFQHRQLRAYVLVWE